MHSGTQLGLGAGSKGRGMTSVQRPCSQPWPPPPRPSVDNSGRVGCLGRFSPGSHRFVTLSLVLGSDLLPRPQKSLAYANMQVGRVCYCLKGDLVPAGERDDPPSCAGSPWERVCPAGIGAGRAAAIICSVWDSGLPECLLPGPVSLPAALWPRGTLSGSFLPTLHSSPSSQPSSPGAPVPCLAHLSCREATVQEAPDQPTAVLWFECSRLFLRVPGAPSCPSGLREQEARGGVGWGGGGAWDYNLKRQEHSLLSEWGC